MSNAGQAVLGIAGAVVGFFVGGPAGAAYGFQLGLLAGSIAFPTQLPHLQGPRLGEGQQTVSVVGQPIPWIFGTQMVGGNIIWASPIREVANSEDVGGKGAPEQSQTTYTYFRSFAILLCEGPIAGVRRIWANGKLVFDQSVPPGITIDEIGGVDGISASIFREIARRLGINESLRNKMTVYLGTEEQMPDPVIESFEGAGNVPAFRGYAYVVFDDIELKPEDGNRVPASWKFEVYENGDSAVIDLAGYSNEVLYPWGSASNNSPLNPLNAHRYSGSFPGGGEVWRTDLELAKSDADFTSEAELVGWASQPNFTQGPLSPHQENVLGERLMINLAYAQESFDSFFNELPDQNTTLCNTPGGEVTWWSGINPLFADFERGTWRHVGFDVGTFNCLVGGGAMLKTNAKHIYVQRVPQAPHDPCEIGALVPGLPGYAVVDGDLLPCGDWELHSATYRALQAYAAPGDVSTAEVTYPLSPVRPFGHLQYDDQEFWEEAYAIEVARGRMDSGLVYGVDYPVTQGFGYRKPQDDDVIDVTPVSLASIVSRICDRVGLTAYDVSDLEDTFVIGYQLARPMAARAGIEPLRSVGFFDVVESTIQLKFPTRGKASVISIEAGDLGAHFAADERPSSVTTQKKLELELPRQIRVHFQNPERDFDPGEELSPARFDTAAEGVLDIDLAVALTPTHAAQIAEVIYRDIWAARWVHATQVDQSQSALEPADCIEIPVDSRTQRLRISALVDKLPNLRALELVRDDDGTYVSHAVGTTPQNTPSTITLIGPVEVMLLDLPALVLTDDDPGFYIAARPLLIDGSFRGATLLRSEDDGASYSTVASVTVVATTGVLLSVVPVGVSTVFDNGNEILVELEQGEVENRSESDVLSGANAAAIGEDGRWEIVQFRDVENVAGNVWRLTGLLRGRRGTEHAIGTSEIGDRFVMLSDGALVRAALDIAHVNATELYKGVPLATSPASVEAFEFTGRAVALKPFSPVHVASTRDDDGNITIDWVRRDRLATDVDIPLSESVEDYEVEVLDSEGGVLRTISVSDSTAVYSDSQQITDFGSLQSSLSIRVYQISVNVGRGYAAEATV